MEPTIIFGLLFMVLGGLVIWFCVMDFDFFFKLNKARRVVKLFGRKGARIFYSIIGLLIIVFSIGIFMSG